jgi:hypothetical protein
MVVPVSLLLDGHLLVDRIAYEVFDTDQLGIRASSVVEYALIQITVHFLTEVVGDLRTFREIF